MYFVFVAVAILVSSITCQFLTWLRTRYNFMLLSLHSHIHGPVVHRCADIHYDDSKLVPVSVIVTFCDNENLYSLLHTVHSIVENSPVHLLAEVILIDDGTRKGGSSQQ